MKQIFANAVKKKSKKWHTTKHTLSFYCEKKAWLCAVYTLIMIFLIIECAILKCNPKYSPLGKNRKYYQKNCRQCQICITLFLIFDFTVITTTIILIVSKRKKTAIIKKSWSFCALNIYLNHMTTKKTCENDRCMNH